MTLIFRLPYHVSMRQEVNKMRPSKGEEEEDIKSSPKKRKNGEEKSSSKLSHPKVEELRLNKHKKKTKDKKTKNQNAVNKYTKEILARLEESSSSDSSSDSESIDSDKAEDWLNQIKILQKEMKKKEKKKELKKKSKKKKKKRSRSSSSSEDEDLTEKKKKKKKAKKKELVSKKKKKPKCKKKVKTSSPSSDSGSSSESSSSEDEESLKEIRKKRKELVKANIKLEGQSSSRMTPVISSEVDIKVVKSKWETMDEEEEPIKIKEEKVIPDTRDMMTRWLADEVVKKEKKTDKLDQTMITPEAKLVLKKAVRDKAQISLDREVIDKVRTKVEKFKKEKTDKTRRSHQTQDDDRKYSRDNSYYESRTIRYRSRSRSKERYRSREHYRSRTRSRSKDRYYVRRRSRTRSRSWSGDRYGRGTWSSESRYVKMERSRSPPRSISLQEKLDREANKRRKRQEEEARFVRIDSPPDPRRDFKEKIDKFVAQQTSKIFEGKIEKAKVCGECGETTHITAECPDSEAKGSNPLGEDGKKLSCAQCGSFR